MATRSLTALAIYTVAIGALAFGACQLAGWPFGKAQLAILVFLALLTGMLMLWQEKAMDKDPKGFMFRYMLGLVLKLFTALVAVVAILMLLPRPQALPLTLTLAIFYLAFLVFSTVRLSARSRHLPKP
ncbi:MAG: hypothetical protein JST45_12375 [Bacteroidetes bacterium]|nr:hypothetical protein [Bacteroidota bacterium]